MVKKNSKTPKTRKSSTPSNNKASGQQKWSSIGQQREDVGPVNRARFDPLNLEIHCPETAILILNSPERPVLSAAAAALADFGAKAQGNLDLLFNLNVVDAVVLLIHHKDVFTQRFALKLLALMSAVRNVQDHLLRDDTYIVYFIEMLETEEDVFLQEFASRILAELTSDPKGLAMFLEKYKDAGSMIRKLSSDDPDIRKNCVEIIDNLLKDSYLGLDVVFGSKDFRFEVFYELFKESYPIIQQLALDVVELLVAHSANENVQENFRFSEGPLCLLDILGNNKWNDLFDKVIRVLNLSCYNSKTAEFMNNTDGTKRLFDFMENTTDDELRFRILGIIVCLGESQAGKKVLYNLELIRFLFNSMEAHWTPDVQATICQALSKMTQYIPAKAEIAKGNPIKYILHLLNNDQVKWPERQAAVFALKELFTSDFQNCRNFLNHNGLVHLTRIIKQPSTEIPWEIHVTIIQALSAMSDYPRLTDDLTDFDLFAALSSHLHPENKVPDELRIACCQSLSHFASSFEVRRILIRAKLQCKIHCLLVNSESIPVLHSLTHLLLAFSSSDDYFAKLCVHEGCLFHMLTNHSISRVIATWDVCIEALFNADLAMKFAYTGHLELRDVTTNGFHLMRYSFCPFPVLDELFRLKLCPFQPIYVANFSTSSDINDEDFRHLTSKCAAFNAARESMRRESYKRGIRVSEATINAWLELKFGRLQLDPDLVAYLERFKIELAAMEKSKVDIPLPGLVKMSRIESRARLLGKFVARQLSGSDPAKSSTCLDQQLEVHLHAIKEQLETNVIPLGLLRVGSYLERAMLFKVIADKIALPASLIRGCYGKSWVQIAVPAVQNEVADPVCEIIEDDGICYCKVSSSDEFPGFYLRENFIVDLMDEPGELIPTGSCKAERYQVKRSACKFACCEKNKKH